VSHCMHASVMTRFGVFLMGLLRALGDPIEEFFSTQALRHPIQQIS